MFDNPEKDLRWLEEQLLAEEEDPDVSSDDEWLEETDWLDEELREAHSLIDNEYGHPARRQAAVFDYEEAAEEEEDMAVYADAPAKSQPHKGKKPKKEKGVGGLVFLACMETLGIIAVLLWWVLWLL